MALDSRASRSSHSLPDCLDDAMQEHWEEHGSTHVREQCIHEDENQLLLFLSQVFLGPAPLPSEFDLGDEEEEDDGNDRR